jgi:hypothetical protein
MGVLRSCSGSDRFPGPNEALILTGLRPAGQWHNVRPPGLVVR